jgi:O-antigen/teichoic acid export membrane protein
MAREAQTSPALHASPGRVRAALIALVTSYVGAGLTIVKGVLLVPLYLRIFGIEVYGAFLASANVVGLLGMVDLGVSSVLSQTLAEAWGARDRLRFVNTTGAGLLVAFGLAAIMLVAGAVLSPYVPGLVKAPTHVHAALSLTFFLTVVGSAITLATTNLLAIGSAWQRAEIGAASRIGSQLFDLLVIVVGLHKGLGVVSLGLGAIVGGGAGFITVLVWTTAGWRTLELSPPRAGWTGVLALARTTVPIMLSRVALQIGSNLEVALISALVNPGAAAVYALTDRVLRVGMNFINPIAGSVLSGLAHFVGQHGSSAALRPSRELLAGWSLAVAAALPPLLALNQDFATLWVGRANFGGLVLSVALCAAALVGARENLLAVILTSSGAIRTVAWISTAQVATLVPVMYVALRVFGSTGVPLASCIVSSSYLVVCARFTNRQLSLPDGGRWRFHLGGSLSITVSFLLGAIEALVLPHAVTWPGLVVKGSLVGLVHTSIAFLLNPAGRAVITQRFVGRRAG